MRGNSYGSYNYVLQVSSEQCFQILPRTNIPSSHFVIEFFKDLQGKDIIVQRQQQWVNKYKGKHFYCRLPNFIYFTHATLLVIQQDLQTEH